MSLSSDEDGSWPPVGSPRTPPSFSDTGDEQDDEWPIPPRAQDDVPFEDDDDVPFEDDDNVPFEYHSETEADAVPSIDEQFHLAAQRGDVGEIDRMLVEDDVDPAQYNNYALGLAAERGHLAVVNRLLEDARVDPSDNDNYAIRRAALGGHVRVVARLLEDERVDPADEENYAIRMAAVNGHAAVVDVLLRDERVDPADDDNYALLMAAERGHLPVVERLLRDARVDPADDDNYAVRTAASNGHLAVVERLLQDARVDPADDDNGSLQLAAENRHAEVVNRLLADERVMTHASTLDILIDEQHPTPWTFVVALADLDSVPKETDAGGNFIVPCAAPRGAGGGGTLAVAEPTSVIEFISFYSFVKSHNETLRQEHGADAPIVKIKATRECCAGIQAALDLCREISRDAFMLTLQFNAPNDLVADKIKEMTPICWERPAECAAESEP